MEYANLHAKFVDGVLYFTTLSGDNVLALHPSTGGLIVYSGIDARAGATISGGGNWYGAPTISGAILESTPTISSANLVGTTVISTGVLVGTITSSTNGVLSTVTVSSGLILYGRTTSTPAGNLSLVIVHGGKNMVTTSTADGIIYTLPYAGSTAGAGTSYTIRNEAAAGTALVVVKTANTTSEYIYGGGYASGAGAFLLANTKATQVKGDFLRLICGGATAWMVDELVGTWANAT